MLGHRVRPGDLPTDSEVREQVLALARSRLGAADPGDDADRSTDDEPTGEVAAMADHLDRFAIYKMRLEPLEAVKQNPK